MKQTLKTAGLGAICSAALLSSGGAASAATYVFSFENDTSSLNANSYGDVVINGEFTTSGPLLPSAITGVTGTVSGGTNGIIVDGAITGLSPYADADNVLWNSGAFTTNDESFSGISFSVTNGTQTADYNLYGWNGSTYLLASTIDSTGYAQNGTNAGTSIGTGSSVTGVPELSTWSLMLIGFGLIGMAIRWHIQADRKLEALRTEVIA